MDIFLDILGASRAYHGDRAAAALALALTAACQTLVNGQIG